MIQKHRIRLNNTNSVNAANKDNKVVVELKQTTKPYLFNNLKDEIDQFEVFQNEREKCLKYRLITTIKPYCTNILFNPITEIVKDEGSSNPKIIFDNEDVVIFNDENQIYGNKSGNRQYMVRNTEYSQKNIGYEYHPGYDIFNNHNLRNVSFKIVNPVKASTSETRRVFNTLEDLARDFNGEVIKMSSRKSIDTIESFDKHLYDNEDIKTIDETINTNLTEDNGWFGFVNKTTILSKKNDGNINNPVWTDLDFNHTMNDKESCEFIDMYPDRTLYSFNPKYNKFQHRPEYNWNIYLTYPFKNFYKHELVLDNNGDSKINSLLVENVKFVTGLNGENILLFQTYCKHNVKGGDTINLYYKKNNKYTCVENIVISDVGDLEKNNDNYFFYTTDMSLFENLRSSFNDDYKDLDIFDENLTKEDINDILSKLTFRFNKIVNGYECEYYIRIFKKLPNIDASIPVTEEDLENKEKLEEYLNKCKEDFDKEIYQLAFASTIYNDKNTQITFTEGINIENILDNRGRPLTEIYFTIIKNNKGNKIWYNEKIDNSNYQDVEFSHCFSDISHGFEYFINDESNIQEHARLSDVRTMHTHIWGGTIEKYDRTNTNYFGWINFENKDIVQGNDNTLENEEKNERLFIGDIVEYNLITCEENILSNGYYRFNSYLRENQPKDGETEKYNFFYERLLSDDFDTDGFKTFIEETRSENIMTHTEGYYYKAHYPIQLKEYGELNQASHFDLKIRNVSKINIGNKIYCVVKTLLPHRLDTGDYLLICEDKRDKVIMMHPSYIFDTLTFAIGEYVDKDGKTITVEDIYNVLKGKYEDVEFKLRRYNEEIPFYASKTPNLNRYMWRDIRNVGDKDNVSLPEYPFANNYYYINQDINFYLKRQDPFNETELYYTGEGIIPNDIYGNVLSQSEYEYKDEKEVTC